MRREAGAPTFVSLNPCLDAILVEVAAPKQILALSHYSRDPSASSVDISTARAFGVTGGTVEEVLALDPDIVLASAFMPAAKRSALDRLGLRVETFGGTATAAESIEQVRKIAGLADQIEAGEQLIRRIEGSPKRPNGREISAVLWQPGQIVPGEATLVSEHLRWAGFTNHSAAQGLGQADYVSLEALLADPPDLVLVAGDRPGQRHPLLSELEETAVEAFPTNLLYCGGPTIPRAREYLLKIRETIE